VSEAASRRRIKLLPSPGRARGRGARRLRDIVAQLADSSFDVRKISGGTTVPLSAERYNPPPDGRR
jgi:hypothetical protein